MAGLDEIRAKVDAARSGVGQMPSNSGNAYFNSQRVGIPQVRPGTPYYDSLIRQQANADEEPTIVETAIPNEDGSYDMGGVIALGPASSAAVAEIGAVAAVAAPAVEEEDDLASKRIVIAFGRDDTKYMVSVEEKPDWDTVGPPKSLDKDVVRNALPLLQQLGVKLKVVVDDLEVADGPEK